jgi:hypothetical protein
VPAGALEDQTGGAVDLAELTLAARALGQRVVLERLDDLEVFAALAAGVLVGGHPYTLREEGLALGGVEC